MNKDEKEYVTKILKLNVEVDSLQDQVASIQERQVANESVATECSTRVTQALRDYAANASDANVKKVDVAKAKYSDAQKRTITERESLTLITNDLNEAMKRSRELTNALGMLRGALYRDGFKEEMESLVVEIEPLLARVCALNSMVNGVPLGILDIGTFVRARLPKLKTEASKELDYIRNDLKDIHADPINIEVA